MKWKYLPAVIAVTSWAAVPLVQYVIRPNMPRDGAVGVLLGSAPDLIVGFCFPFTILLRPAAWTRSGATVLFWVWCLITAAAIAYDEFAAPIGPNVFDPKDLIAGGAGILLAVAVFYWPVRPHLYGSRT